jgi:EmrB/QacA subfamily drug resistance transporter
VTFAIAALAVFAVSLDGTALFVAFPAICDDFAGTPIEALGWILNGYTVVYGALLVPAGRLADQLGRRRAFVVGVVVFTVASALCAVAPGVGGLILGRVLQGVGAAALTPASLALILDAAPADRRSLLAGLWGAVGALAAAIGPSLGALLIASVGWRFVFVVNVPVGVIAVLGARRLLRESRDEQAGAAPRALPTAMLIACATLLGLAIVEVGEWGLAASFGLAVAGLATLGGFVWTELRARAPSFDLTLFRDRSFALASAATLVFGVAFAAMFLGFVFFLTEAWGYTVLEAGLAISPGPLVVIPVAIVGGRIATRVGHRALVVAGGLIYAAGGAALVWLASQPPDFLGGWLPIAILTGVGVGLVLPSLAGASVAGLPPARFGIGSGIHQAIRQLGSVLGVALAIGVSGGAWAFEITFGGIVVAGLICAALGLGLRAIRERPRRATSARA